MKGNAIVAQSGGPTAVINASAAGGNSEYLLTKGEGEDIAHLAGGSVAVTSFRPSVIFGPDDSFFNRFAELLKLGRIYFRLHRLQYR